MSTQQRQTGSAGGTSGASGVWKAAVAEAAAEAAAEAEAVAVSVAVVEAAVAAAAGAMRTARTVNRAQQRAVKVSAAPTETRRGPQQACLPEETRSLHATALPPLEFNGREPDDGEMEKTTWAPLETRETRGHPTGGPPPAGTPRQAGEVPTAPVTGPTARETS